MHRSGTSLIASYLSHCGLDIGEDLIGASIGNSKGHFEDRTFVEFHRQMLKRSEQGTFLGSNIETNNRDKQLATDMIQHQSHSALWGWKDPRTVLFLDFWHSILGVKAKYVFIYREPGQVIDSLLRRNTDEVFWRKPTVAAKSWVHYNSEVLKFMSETDACCALYNYADVLQHPNRIIEFINHNEDHKLTERDIGDVYTPELISDSTSLFRSKMLSHLYQRKLSRVYSALQKESEKY